MAALRPLPAVTLAVLDSPQLGIETGSVPCKHERTCEHRCHSLSASRSGSAEQLPEVPACREPGAVIPPSRVRKGGAQSGSRFCWEGKLELTEALRRESQPREFQKGSAQENPEGSLWRRGSENVSGVVLRAVAFLILLSTPAGTRVVATDLVIIAMDGLGRHRFFASIERELRLRT